MGYFSWTCAKCGHGVLGDTHENHPYHESHGHAVVLFENGDHVSGLYDGYGRIVGRLDGLADLADGEFKMVHRACYNGESFEELGCSGHDNNQGAWGSERELEERFGPPASLVRAVEHLYVCTVCNRGWRAKWSGGRCAFGCAGPVSCAAHKPRTVADADKIIARAYHESSLKRLALVKKCMEERGVSHNEAWNLVHSKNGLGSKVEVEPCKGCLAFRREMVIPLLTEERLAVCQHPGCSRHGMPQAVDNYCGNGGRCWGGKDHELKPYEFVEVAIEV